MQAFSIISQKEFMAALLAGSAFDNFLVCEAKVTTFTTFSVDGSWNPEFLDDEDDADAPPWRLVKPFIFSLVRGKRVPLSMKAVLRLSPEGTAKILAAAGSRIAPQDVAGLYLTIRYGEGKIILTAGSSLRIFTPDKTLDRTWEEMTDRFLTRLQIAHETLS